MPMIKKLKPTEWILLFHDRPIKYQYAICNGDKLTLEIVFDKGQKIITDRLNDPTQHFNRFVFINTKLVINLTTWRLDKREVVYNDINDLFYDANDVEYVQCYVKTIEFENFSSELEQEQLI